MRLKSLLFALLLLCFAPCQVSAQSESPAKGGYARIGVLVAMEKEMKMLKDCFTDDRVVIRQCDILAAKSRHMGADGQTKKVVGRLTLLGLES